MKRDKDCTRVTIAENNRVTTLTPPFLPSISHKLRPLRTPRQFSRGDTAGNDPRRVHNRNEEPKFGRNNCVATRYPSLDLLTETRCYIDAIIL